MWLLVPNNTFLIIIKVVIITLLNTKSLLLKRLTGKYHLLYNKMKPPAAKMAEKTSQLKVRPKQLEGPLLAPTSSPPSIVAHRAQTKRSAVLNLTNENCSFSYFTFSLTEREDAVSKGWNVTIGS